MATSSLANSPQVILRTAPVQDANMLIAHTTFVQLRIAPTHGAGIEEWARDARYQALRAMAEIRNVR